MLLPVLRTCLLTAPMGEGRRQRCALAAGQLVGGECWGGASTGTPTRGRKRPCLLLHVSYPGQSVKSKTPWGHQTDFSGGFPARILIPPCRDQNPRLAPRLVEHADDLLQLVLRDSCVHRRRLNVRVPQVLLHHS